MKKINDEMVMAYVDGELDEQQSEIVKQALQDNDELQKMAYIFQETNVMLQGVYDRPLTEKTPSRLIKTVTRDKKPRIMEKWKNFCYNKLRFSHMQTTWVSVTILVFIIAGGLLYCINNIFYITTHKYPDFLYSEDFRIGLDRIPSGKMFALKKSDTAIRIVPVLSFRDREFSFCREFDVISGPANTTSNTSPCATGIACRDNQGNWKIVVYATTETNSHSLKGNNTYELAGRQDLIDTVVEKRIVGQPLSLSQELEQIRKGWKKQ